MSSTRRSSVAAFEERIPSRMEAAEFVCLKLRDLLQRRGLSGSCFSIELIARECLANAVIHGNKNDPNKFVYLQMWIGRLWIRVEVTDEGMGFDWRNAIAKLTEIDETSGRGLHMCAEFADCMQFNRRGNRVTCWTTKN